jgi:3-methylfumaryl-CoA hydratase
MTDTPSLDIAILSRWIGRSESNRDAITPRLVREMNAMLDRDTATPEAGMPAPLAVHWCLAPTAVRASSIGPDGHPARDGLLSPAPLPRRMWAGGQLHFHDGLIVGDAVERRSRIADVTVKQGRTGTLCFVTVDHEIFSPRGLAITERQDIAYRELGLPPQAAKPPRPADLTAPHWQRPMHANPVLLFRYSALTFNGHRIHYDRRYAVNEEGYPGLVVHGPLQATLLMDLAAEILGRPLQQFCFRSVNPLFDFQDFTLGAAENEAGLRLWIMNEDRVQTMKAEAK